MPRKVHLHYSANRERDCLLMLRSFVPSSAVHFCLGDSLLSQTECVYSDCAHILFMPPPAVVAEAAAVPPPHFHSVRSAKKRCRLVRLPRTHPRKFVVADAAAAVAVVLELLRAKLITFHFENVLGAPPPATNHPLQQQRQPQKKEKPGAAAVRMCSLCIRPDSIQSGLPCTRSGWWFRGELCRHIVIRIARFRTSSLRYLERGGRLYFFVRSVGLVLLLVCPCCCSRSKRKREHQQQWGRCARRNNTDCAARIAGWPCSRQCPCTSRATSIAGVAAAAAVAMRGIFPGTANFKDYNMFQCD